MSQQFTNLETLRSSNHVRFLQAYKIYFKVMTYKQDKTMAHPSIIYTVEFEDTQSKRRQNFQSEDPFEHLEVTTEGIDELIPTKGHKSDMPALEVITSISGIALSATELKRSPSTSNIKQEVLAFKDISINRVGPTRLVIHSQMLLAIIQKVVIYYPRIGDNLKIPEPYSVLIHYLSELKNFHIQHKSE